MNSWSGSIEIGVTTCDPDNLSFPISATAFRDGTWVMSGSSVLKGTLYPKTLPVENFQPQHILKASQNLQRCFFLFLPFLFHAVEQLVKQESVGYNQANKV